MKIPVTVEGSKRKLRSSRCKRRRKGMAEDDED